MRNLIFCLSLAMLIFGGISWGSISIGPYTFDDNAFPDAARYISGGPPTLSFATSGDINTDLLTAANPPVNNYIFGTPVQFQLDFIDNKIVNDTGADLVLFELGTDDAAQVSIFLNNAWTSAITYLMTPTGYSAAGFSLNAVAIDLGDFGAAPLDLVGSIRLLNTGAGGTTESSSIAAVAALNSIPEPATLSIFALGALLTARKRRT